MFRQRVSSVALLVVLSFLSACGGGSGSSGSADFNQIPSDLSVGVGR